MELIKKQEEDLNKLVEEGIIQDKEQFIKEAISIHLNKPKIKKELKKINKNKNGKIEKDVVRRIGSKFNDEIEDIKKERIKLKKEKRISNGYITNMIPRHDMWPVIKEDLINHEYNKK